MFNKKQSRIETKFEAEPLPPTKPTILEIMEARVKHIEENIRAREIEIVTLNKEVVEIDAQMAWLRRHPEAERILRSVQEKFGQ